jgi:hypothetical protein
MPEEKIINLGEGINVSQPTSEPKVPNLSGNIKFPEVSLDFSRVPSKTGVPGGNLSAEEIWANLPNIKTHVPQLPLSSIYIGNRYKSSRPYETDLEEKYAQQPIPCPFFWGGYRVKPTRFEFWKGRPSRLHDRICYAQKEGHNWEIHRLAP